MSSLKKIRALLELQSEKFLLYPVFSPHRFHKQFQVLANSGFVNIKQSECNVFVTITDAGKEELSKQRHRLNAFDRCYSSTEEPVYSISK